MKRTTAIVCLSSLLITAGCSDSKSGGKSGNSEQQASGAVIKQFADAWVKAWAPNGKPDAAGALTDNPTVFAKRLDDVDSALVTSTVTVTPQGDPKCSDDNNCTQDLAVEAQLRGIGTMKWTSTAAAVKTGDNWKVKASGDTIYPGLGDNNYLKRVRALPARASILDRNGVALTANRQVVIVGVASGTKATPATYAAFAKYLDVDAAKLAARAKAAPAGEFVDAITIRAEEWEALRPTMTKLPGVLTMGGTQSLPPTANFARSLIGTMKTATEDTLKNAGPTASAQDQVGTTGLQYSFQQQLAGTPGGTVALRDGKTKLTIKTVFTQKGTAGKPVKTTIDTNMQKAAEAALATSKLPASLVAVQASTGQILAAANGPDPTSYNRAFQGRYAPGSTFKIVTSAALLGSGESTTTQLPCTDTINVFGKTFKNYDALAAYGAGTMQKAFNESCNTAFISQHGRLPKDGMTKAASMFGIGRDLGLSLSAYGGQVPMPKDDVEEAASMIGQGTVTASPLAIALVAATVDHGTAMKPVLVPGKDAAGAAASPLPAATVAALRTFMRTTVTGGTGKVLAGSGTVAAKTGTAEVVVNGKVTTNAWMAGYRGDVAFAVIVEGGESGSHTAGPILKPFLAAFK
ncbi:penicillin-binding transpeptidase domain-containing protein [Kribbella solani]|uniref:penicillin-binding transpeptidase domain-containing protein n=1 Tax=Kribbella solani TaxID=236067 RepID=UPI0029AB649B|nr:penicillin-binding transpeptidase domain-containing protein [Kribbella solani]MDX2973516.1 penicillin-binding transpeptidase domain-containing protein [Kribbella solani]MDX3003992.1 penicillin-binding transpeptidase domain-containing protein [Kribbella solani]